VRRRRSAGRSRSNRKTRWTGGIFQGDVTLAGDVNGVGSGFFEWVSFWFKWPAGHVGPHIAGNPANVVTDSRLEPSDETLIRTRSTFHVLTAYDITPNVSQTWDVVIGLIAFDGGSNPEILDLATHSPSSGFAPPNPAISPDDDWLLRNVYGVARINPESFDDLADSYLQSLAKRKLPPDTGILGVIGVANLLEDAFMSLTWNWDVRMAVRTGYTA